MPSLTKSPRGTLATRTLAMPADANPSGDIFGGWVLAQMDIAGGITAGARAAGRVATVAVDAMVFHRPVYVGDVLCTYADILRVARTSIALHIEAWPLRSPQGERAKVTEGTLPRVATYDPARAPPVPPANQR